MSKFSVVPQKETVAVWSITPEAVINAVIDIDATKNLRILRKASRRLGEKIPREFLSELRGIPVVVSLHSSFAYTAILPFSITLTGNVREDRLSFQSILREYVNRGNLETRLEAAKALGVEDLDAVLFDARVMCLRMDGKDVAGWPQLAGKKLEGELHLLFTTRDMFTELHDILHSRTELFVTEEGKAALALLDRRGKAPFRAVDADPGRAEFLVLDPKHLPIFRKLKFEWDSPLTLLRDEWSLSESAARGIWADAAHNQLSATVERFFTKLAESSAEAFRKAIQKTKFRGNIYFRGEDMLPFSLPSEIDGVTLLEYPFVEIWKELGFEGEAPSSHEDQSLILPFLEFYYHRGDPAHHRALARQIHWIAP